MAFKLMRKLRSAYLSPEDMKDVLMSVGADDHVVREWQDAIDKVVIYGARVLYEYDPEMAEGLGIRETDLSDIDDLTDHEPWLIPGMRDEFRTQTRVQFNVRINKSDDLSKIGFTALDLEESQPDKWPSYSARQWTDWAMQRGNNATVRGGVKRGKTNFSLLMAEYFLELGWTVVANVIVVEPPKNFYYCPTLSDMIIRVCEARLRNERVLIIFDEGALSWAKIDTVQAQNKALSKILLTLGKLWSTLVYISHFKSDIPSVVAKTIVADFEKVSVRQVVVSVSEGLPLTSRTITSVPETTLKYNPDQPQYMTVDLDVDAMFQYMSRVTDIDGQWSDLKKWVEANARGEQTSLSPKDVALYLDSQAQLKGEKFTVRELANLTGASKSAVSEWVRDSRRTRGEEPG